MRLPNRLRLAISSLARPPVQITMLLLVLAAVPAFTAAPGLMPADSKLYLYLNPGRLISDGLWSFDPRQFAGWVPHQHITFLWPSGPWFWTMETLGFPDWVAHRAWLTLVFFAAGLGVVWTARLLGLTWAGCAIAAVIYQLSPYTLAYVSRTSVMLLPWAGLGWILALTVMSARSAAGVGARQTWKYPALLALVILTVGSVNPTALAMIAPAPVLWLLHEVLRRAITWRSALAVTARITTLSIGVSAWWMAMVVTQRRHGADVLGFSETLNDVSATATSTEVLRGLGYWLFYVREAFGPATTASGPYLTSVLLIAVSFTVAVAGLWALATTQWVHRSFAAALMLIGTVLAVGVYPIENPSPLMGMLADTDIALALRSSTRAVPMLLLGLALLIGARLPAQQTRAVPRRVLIVAVTVICLINLPAWRSGGFVDPDLLRDSDPPVAWLTAAAAINARPDGYRVMQIPGAEFGSYRWGHTVDQPLVGLIDRGLITRDLLPLGSATAMDLVFSLDDRIQRGVVPSGALSVVSRLLGADLIWLTNDLAHERYNTVRPETVISVLEADQGLRLWDSFGAPERITSDRERIDPISLSDPALNPSTSPPVPPVMLWEVTNASPVIRARSSAVVIGGSADGIIDAAGAQIIDGSELILFAATSTPEQMALAERLIITDSARARPRQWRTSQDVVGATESLDAELLALDPIVGDRRLGVGQGPYVTAEQQGTVRATASSYGDRFAFLPEMRPAMAIDGDPTTAWRVAGHGDPVGERLRLYVDEPVDHLQLWQPVAGRHITSVRIEIAHRSAGNSGDDADLRVLEVQLDDASLQAPGQRVDLSSVVTTDPTAIGDGVEGAMRVDIVITGVSAGPPVPVGFVEVGPFSTVEYLQIPEYGPHRETSYLFTRDRVEPRDLWRTDPEPHLNRRFTVNETDTDQQMWKMEVGISLDPRASDATLAHWMATAAIADSRLQGVIAARGHSAVDGDPATAWISEVQTDDLSDGTELLRGPGLSIFGLTGGTDRIQITQPEGEFSRITEIEIDAASVDGSAGPMRFAVIPDQSGGVSEILLPRVIGPGPVEIRVTGMQPRQINDQRYGHLLAAPVAISEIDFGVPLMTASPSEVPECITDLLWLNERPIPLRMEITTGTAELCDPDGVDLSEGSHMLRSRTSEEAPGLKVDQILVQLASGPATGGGEATAELLHQTRLSRSVEITNCVPHCWVVLGEGHNPAWRAEVAGRSLGDPVVVDGGFNGWFLTPEDLSSGRVQVEMSWTAQTPLTVAFGISGAFIVLCAWLGRPRRGRAIPSLSAPIGQEPRRYSLWRESDWRVGSERVPIGQRLAEVGLWMLAAALLIGPAWAIVAFVLSAPKWWGLRIRMGELVALLSLTLSVMIVIALQIRRAPLANMAWPEAVADPHQLAMFGVISVITVVVFGEDRQVESR